MTIPERMRRLRRLTGLLTPAEAAAEGRSTDGVSGRLDAMQQRQRFAEVVSAALTVSFNGGGRLRLDPSGRDPFQFGW